MPYAINVADWTTQRGNKALGVLVGPVVSQDGRIVEAEPGRVDSPALVLDCDDKRGEAIVSIVRKRLPKHELRMYKKTGGRWKRV